MVFSLFQDLGPCDLHVHACPVRSHRHHQPAGSQDKVDSAGELGCSKYQKFKKCIKLCFSKIFKFYFWLLYVAIGLPTFASSIRIIMELRYKKMFLKHFLALQKLCCHDFFE